MSGAGTMKPRWLADFQAYLRARPVRRAALWAVSCCLAFQLLFLWEGEQLTGYRFAIEASAWAVAGLFFYIVMRWWDAKHAG